jgi:hypothetical protein
LRIREAIEYRFSFALQQVLRLETAENDVKVEPVLESLAAQ